jgi:hypothetical protein
MSSAGSVMMGQRSNPEFLRQLDTIKIYWRSAR